MASESATNALNQLELNECPIANLADDELAKIFKHLPPFERLIVSEVCGKWSHISLSPWRDVAHLDLSQVPTQNIHAVIRKCPTLTSVSALRQNLGDLGRFLSRLGNVGSLKCVDCVFSPSGTSFRSALWEELIWHNSTTVSKYSDDINMLRERTQPYENPATLRRLQVTAVNWHYGIDDNIAGAVSGLPLLESCILAAAVPYTSDWLATLFSRTIWYSRAALTNLRELYLESFLPGFSHDVSALPNLKILYMNNIKFGWSNVDFIMTQHARLCVIVLTASCDSDFDREIQIPARKLFPNGFNAPPVPQLHVLLGKTAAGKLRFHRSPNDVLKIYPIDAPLPEFLEKEEIKPILEGSWIASRIKEGAKDGANLADYSFEGNAESILYVEE